MIFNRDGGGSISTVELGQVTLFERILSIFYFQSLLVFERKNCRFWKIHEKLSPILLTLKELWFLKQPATSEIVWTNMLHFSQRYLQNEWRKRIKDAQIFPATVQRFPNLISKNDLDIELTLSRTLTWYVLKGEGWWRETIFKREEQNYMRRSAQIIKFVRFARKSSRSRFIHFMPESIPKPAKSNF